MKFCIIGWYGTETMGDIAILDGIFDILYDCDPNCSIFLGSIYPFYSERTVYLNKNVFVYHDTEIIPEIFDLKNSCIRKKYIKESDVIIIGGGPLMSIPDIVTICDSVEYAQKHGIMTMVLGCGIGPLKKTYFNKYIDRIISLSDLCIFRDEIAFNYARSIKKNDHDIFDICDPAFISVERYLHNNPSPKRNDLLSVNFRNYPSGEYIGDNHLDDDHISLLLSILSDKYNILLIPMHTFFVGGDDRYYLDNLKMKNNDLDNIDVLNEPVDLYCLYDLFYNSFGCVGMRYHSVVFQSLLNGNNIIIDYTEKNSGKTSGFIKKIDGCSFYDNRILSVHDMIDVNKMHELCNALNFEERFTFKFFPYKKMYIDILNEYFS